MGDHTETVQVDYDPERITFAQLLDIFWKYHNPARQSGSRQYMNAIFYHNEAQHRQALASKAAAERKTGQSIKTEVAPIRSFTMAETYHQKYILKNHHALLKEIMRIYPDPQDFVNSTAVARLNGYTGRNGTAEQLSREIDLLGLGAYGRNRLEDLVY
jgi:peptide-methionine (S)-S-oxide reductase